MKKRKENWNKNTSEKKKKHVNGCLEKGNCCLTQVALELSRSKPFEFTRREAQAEERRYEEMTNEQRDLISEGIHRRPKEEDDRIVSRDVEAVDFSAASTASASASIL